MIEAGLYAARTGDGGAVFLVGEGGIGKSRLGTTAAELAADLGVRLMSGRCSTTGPAVPYRPFTEAVLSLLRSGAPVDLDTLGPYRPVLGRMVPDLRLAPTDQGTISPVILAEAVLRLTALAGQGAGCLLVLEDLHHADPETLALAEYLADNLARQPVLLLGTLRPEPGPALHLVRSVVQRGHGTLRELNRLDRSQVLELTAALLGTSPADVPAVASDLVWAGSAGNPYLVEDLLTGMSDSGVLVRSGTGWRVPEEALVNRPETFVRSLRRRVGQLPGPARPLVMAGALLGCRFPLAMAQTVTGMPDRTLLTSLQRLLAAQLVVADEQVPDWYRFQHPLMREALLSLLEPAERVRLARRTADVVTAVHPGLPGQWCQLTADLRLAGGERSAAGRLFAEAGRRHLAEGAADRAVPLLDQAWHLLADDDPTVRADTLEPLVVALTEAGRADRALSAVRLVEELAGALDERRLARLHTQLAWAALRAGEYAEGRHRVRVARTLLGPDAAPAEVVGVDVVAAYLELDGPAPGRPEQMAAALRQAAAVAEGVPLPVVACQAWQLLGTLTRRRYPADATACLERGRLVAVEHDLPYWELRALVQLGTDEAMRTAEPELLEQTRTRAARIGAVTVRYQAEAVLALHAILADDADRAATLIDGLRTTDQRPGAGRSADRVLLLHGIQAAHRGQRQEMENAFAQLTPAYAHRTGPLVDGLARTVCALLEEDRARAVDDLDRARAVDVPGPTLPHLDGRYGLHLLLTALHDRSDHTDPAGTVALVPLRWDLQFALLARAVRLGRDGDGDRAGSAVTEALRVGQPYPLGRHLGLRLVAEAAVTDGWGTPVDWLRTTEDYFHSAGLAAVAGACRTLLRAAGARVTQRRCGFQQIPTTLRRIGVTVREFEVLQLLVKRLSNREIAARLYLSARTVERHISNLIAKTGLPNRIALSDFASRGYRA